MTASRRVSRKRKISSATEESPRIEVRLFNPEEGDPPLRMEPLLVDRRGVPTRSNFFTILWIEDGEGTLGADLNHHVISGPSIWFLNPYQTFFLSPLRTIRGVSLQFHANFFCVETHHQEIGCNGVLFNNPYRDPQLPLDKNHEMEFRSLFGELAQEIGKAELASSEMLVSLMKILMIKATRLKLSDIRESIPPSGPRKPEILSRLVEMIEEQYTVSHRPVCYARQLAMTPKALGKLVKKHLGVTISEMIQGRILNHAKWQLLHTLRPVKEIAAEVGYGDEFYFSRFFKRRTGLSPSGFREYETRVRSGRNLSI